MSTRLVLSALTQFTAQTAGRNMTKAAYAAVMAGVAAMPIATAA
jgi:voltage-gated potassium channel